MEVLFLFIMSYMLSLLKKDFDTEHAHARRDHLTGAANRRSFQAVADYEINQSRRHERVLSVALIDLDNFKAVNDQLGHHVGDDLLVKVVQIIKENVRGTDFVARLGGDEFCVLFPETDTIATANLLENLQKKFLEVMVLYRWPVTFSIGAITYKIPPVSAHDMVKEVDANMYAAKLGGKNRIIHVTMGIPSPS